LRLAAESRTYSFNTVLCINTALTGSALQTYDWPFGLVQRACDHDDV
jgi:hypothetical protein